MVGGGDTAVEEAVYLTKYAEHVHLLVRRDQLRASKVRRTTLEIERGCRVSRAGNARER